MKKEWKDFSIKEKENLIQKEQGEHKKSWEEISKEIIEIVNCYKGNEELRDGIEVDLLHNGNDLNLFNMIAARINSEVKNRKLDEENAKNMFREILEKLDGFNNKEIKYYDLGREYSYLREIDEN